MTRPQAYLLRMLLFLAAVIAACVVIYPTLLNAFMANAFFNGMILGVLLLGVLLSFRQVWALRPEVDWLEHLRQESRGGLIFPGAMAEKEPPRLLGTMATMIAEKKGKISLSTISMRTLLDGLHVRIAESHEISRYLIGLLIFLGLLGTFWGLLQTVNAVGDALNSLNASVGDPALLFEELKLSLEQPLSGMGTAFSSSLFGLAGSLVLGFLELQSSQAHNRFMNDLEEWLSSITRLSSGGGVGDGDQGVPAYIHALLEQSADSLDSLQRTLQRGEEDRQQVNQNLLALTEHLSSLSDQMRTEQSVLLRLAESQSQLRPILTKLADSDGMGAGAYDEQSRAHLRNIEVHLERLIGRLSSDREATVKEVRSEIRLLARTIAAIAEEGEAS